MFSNNLLMGAASAGGESLVEVGNSALFDDANSEYLSRTPSSAGNLRKWTLSLWAYRCNLGTGEFKIWSAISGSNFDMVAFSGNELGIEINTSTSSTNSLRSNALFRDIGWYHIVVVWDSDNAIATNRIRAWVNNERITSWRAGNFPGSAGVNSLTNSTVLHTLGAKANVSQYFDGYLAESVLIDGLALEPTSFGQYDSTGTFWTPLASATIQELTFGTNGFYLANKVTDQPQLDFQSGDDNTLADSQIKSLLHFDGSDASTTFTDSSQKGPSWTAAGNAQLDTAQKKFGTASLLLDGTGDSISTPSLGLPGTDPFTIDMWVRRNGANTNNGIFCFGVNSGGTSNQQIRLLTSTDNKLIISTNNDTVITASDHSTSLPDGEFAHVAVTRSGNTIYLFQNGTLLASTSFTRNLIDPNPYYIGKDINAANNFNGHVDEFRVILGECKYTSNFTVETSAYSNPPTANNFTNNNTVTTSTHTPTQLWPIFNAAGAGFTSGVFGGNTKVTYGASGTNYSIISFPGTGKFVAQCTADDVVSNGIGWVALNAEGGVSTSNALVLNEARWMGLTGGNWIHAQYVDFVGGTNLGTVKTSASDGDILQLEWDNGTLTVQINGTRYTPSNWTAVDTSLNWAFMSRCAGSGTETWDFGQDGFTPHDTSYSYVNTTTLASAITRTKSNLEEYFDSTIYEGNGAVQRVGKFLPFTNSYTVGNGAMFIGANSEDLSRGSMSGTATTFTVSMWVKRAEPAVGGTNANFMFTTASDAGLSFSNNSTADVLAWYSGSYTATTRVFNDQSSWMNVVFKSDSGTGTAYVNGVEMLSSLTVNGADATMAIGSYNNSSNFWDGYMAEVVMIDGTALEPSSFGQVDTSTGRWIPKDVSGLTFGTNGFYLNFANSSDVGNDVSGNNNDFTNNNTVVQVADTPTVNIATLDSNRSGGGTISNGNKTLVTTGSSDKSTKATIRLPNTGKYYWESNLNVASSASIGHVIFLTKSTQALTTGNGSWTDTILLNRSNSGSVKLNGTDIFTISGTASINDKYQVAVDLDNNKMWFGINNSFFNATGGTDGNPSTGANAMIVKDFAGYFPMFGNFNTQQTVRFDSADWTYTPPTDYVSLTQDSLPTGESYQTAFSWIKNRDASDNHMLFDRVRGIYNDIHSNTQDAEVTNVNTLQRFLNGGVQVGNDVQVNTASESYVAWNWYMETAGTGSSNTDGTINTTSTLVDTNLGLSVSKYTGTGANATIGHGLGVVPEFFMVKRLNTSGTDWMVYFSALGATKNLVLNNNGTGSTSITRWNNTEPTSSVISLGTTTAVNGSSDTYVCYAFAPSQFTAIGSYKGNGNANGSFVPTINSLGIPLKVQWVMIKRTDAANSWQLTDTVRTPNNASSLILQAQLSNAELDNSDMDNLTSGFKLRSTDNIFNNSSGTYVYLAFGTPLIDVDGRIITGR